MCRKMHHQDLGRECTQNTLAHFLPLQPFCHLRLNPPWVVTFQKGSVLVMGYPCEHSVRCSSKAKPPDIVLPAAGLMGSFCLS